LAALPQCRAANPNCQRWAQYTTVPAQARRHASSPPIFDIASLMTEPRFATTHPDAPPPICCLLRRAAPCASSGLRQDYRRRLASCSRSFPWAELAMRRTGSKSSESDIGQKWRLSLAAGRQARLRLHCQDCGHRGNPYRGSHIFNRLETTSIENRPTK
jgi:hypothetical protein